jgi:hypothetical protein
MLLTLSCRVENVQIYYYTNNIGDRVEVMLIRLYCYEKKVDRYGISVSKNNHGYVPLVVNTFLIHHLSPDL